MSILAEQLARIACDREETVIASGTMRAGAVTNPTGSDSSPEAKRAMGRWGSEWIRPYAVQPIVSSSCTACPVAPHRKCSGSSATITLSRPREEGLRRCSRTGLCAAGGLAADCGGRLTLGAGMLVGGILGAVGAGSAARGYNLVRGDESNSYDVRRIFSPASFDQLCCVSGCRALWSWARRMEEGEPLSSGATQSAKS